MKILKIIYNYFKELFKKSKPTYNRNGGGGDSEGKPTINKT